MHHSQLKRTLRNCAALAVLWGTVAPASNGQTPVAVDPPSAITTEADITFQLLATAPYASQYRVHQVRRFRQPDGSMVGVHENLIVNGNGSPSAQFKLDLVSVDGVAPNTPAMQKWSETYRRFASLFHEHGEFRVHNAPAAAQNYKIAHFGQGSRIGRQIRRVVIYPNTFDKAIWVLELDEITGIALYQAEYDYAFHLLAELEVTSFTPGLPAGRVANWWQPQMPVTPQPDVQSAIQQIAPPPTSVLFDPAVGQIMPEYQREFVQVVQQLLGPGPTMVIGYTDGIDEFFVCENEGATDPFAGLPSQVPAKGALQPETIARYDDPSLRVYMFHHHGVLFQVAGRGSLQRLEAVSERIHRQAVTGR